jgi:hypothetical protein
LAFINNVLGKTNQNEINILNFILLYLLPKTALAENRRPWLHERNDFSLLDMLLLLKR